MLEVDNHLHTLQTGVPMKEHVGGRRPVSNNFHVNSGTNVYDKIMAARVNN